MSKFDDLLNQLGTGKWNLVVFLAAGYWMIQVPCQSVGGAFLTPEVEHSCRPDDQQYNVTQVSRCTYNVTTFEGRYEEQPCSQWDFDNTTYTNTITSEFQLVCEYRFLRPAYKSLYFFGAFFGAPLSGWLSDKYGRKTMLCVGTAAYAILANALCWLPNVSVILVARFFLGAMHPTSLFCNYVLAMEVCKPKYRSIVGIVIFLPWTFSVMALGAYGHLLRDWRWFTFAVSLPALLYLPVLRVLDESPRWLIVKGRHREALRVLQKAARWNGVKLPAEDELLALMVDIQKEQESDTAKNNQASSPTLLEHLKKTGSETLILLRTRRLRAITLYLYVNHVVAGMVYYGLSLGGDKFGVDPFVYMALSGAMELPGGTLTIPLVEKIGRRTSNVLLFSITAAALLVLGVVPSGIGWLIMAMALLGKLAISAAYQVVILHAAELFPTEVRVRGLGTCNMMAKVGSILAPFLVEGLGAIGSWAPLVFFGGGGLIAGLITLRLPETRGAPMPDTVVEFEAAGRPGRPKSPPSASPSGFQEEEEALT